MEEFKDCLEDLEVQDHPFVGPLFTWSNKQDDSYLARKLDRILTNSQWLLDFPDSYVEFKAPGVSDHCPGLIWTQNEAQILFNKMKRLKPILKELNRNLFSDISVRVAAKRAELESVQLSILSGSLQFGVEDEKKIRVDLVDLEVAELDFYKHRAKIHWLQEGDMSTKFFHQRVESKKKRNTIRVIRSENGQCFESFDGMAAELVDFYSKLIGVVDPMVQDCSPECLKELLSYALPAGAERVLVGEVSDNEVKEALFRQGKDKSPGPDGFTSWFFKVAWGIVHSDFLNVVSQSAFVKGRSITDNTLLAQEIVKGYSRMNLSPRCAIKIDLQKAFDSISWNFLLNVLRAMGLPARFCGWIETCVTTLRYSIALNDSLVGYFKGPRGVRQGDPLSPYLFVIVMNVLSRLLDVAARNGIFRFHPRCKRISLTHICFGDDLLLFCHGSMDSVLGVTSILEKFYHLSGLNLNALKIELYVCGINGGELEQIQAATGFRTGLLPIRYLGVPLVTRKLSRKDYAALLERIKDKLRQLVLSKGVIHDIERLCMRFFWKGNDFPAHGERVSWNQICSIKSEGGLGLKSLTCWNKICCFMLVRNILAGEGSLWVAWIKAYCFKLDDYWNVVNKPHFSWILRKLIKLREEVRGLFPASGSWLQIKGDWIWNSIRDRKSKVTWHRVIWFPTHIPKFSLITWMAVLDRLPTRERLCRFAVLTDASCGLCGTVLESRSHLFIDCSFSREVWNVLLQLCGLRMQWLSWDHSLCWLVSNLKGKSLLVHILKLAWTGFVYFIWDERNRRCFRGMMRSVDTIVNIIKEAVRIKLYRHYINRLDSVNR
ncbi:uncharacterized protein LOC120211619 [Hibiscus syriacus]|uniref:uncharacterized protein LOC120211619 n=1 Tax=Hibiscus syriacus TaxID=106335 RepID=UPI00192105E9|nr:uncharacterized protein LOC120211619 [Hibiscus syriacus]